MFITLSLARRGGLVGDPSSSPGGRQFRVHDGQKLAAGQPEFESGDGQLSLPN